MCPTLCNPMDCSTQASLSLTTSQSLPKFMFIESVMPSSHLILFHPLLLLPSFFSSIRVFFNESAVHIRWSKYWSFSFNISPSNESSGLISFKIDWSDFLIFRGTAESSPAPHFESISSLALCLLYRTDLISLHDYWKDHSLDCTDLCQQSGCLCFLTHYLGLS